MYDVGINCQSIKCVSFLSYVNDFIVFAVAVSVIYDVYVGLHASNNWLPDAGCTMYHDIIIMNSEVTL